MTDAQKTITAAEAEAAFKAELQALLVKHGAVIKVDSMSRARPGFGEPFLSVYISGRYDDCHCLQEYTNFKLPGSLNGI